MKNKKGFTLAEILLTLTIIGVVAAISVPALIANTQKQEYVTALQKFYAVFGQAISKYAADEGSIGDLSKTQLFQFTGTCTNWSCPPDDECAPSSATYCTPDYTFTATILGKYFNNIKNCGSELGCWHGSSSGASAILANGSLLNFTSFTDPSYTSFSGPAGLCPFDVCGQVDIDVNGFKKPNKWGRDKFIFYISKKGQLFPAGTSMKNPATGSANCNYGNVNNTNKAACNNVDATPNSLPWSTTKNGIENYNCNSNRTTSKCTARIIEEGWQMNY